ncbi:MAG: endonuclease [Saprospiraceae bacterium]
MNCRFIIFILLELLLCDLHGQFKNQVLFPGENGSNLLSDLFNSYKTNTVLSYTDARIKMYKEIYNVHDSVYCVYSRYSLYLDPTYPNPIDYLSKGGSSNGINCEHSFPQSKGAETGNARSDMHHLYPAKASVNEARSNYPYSEIEDFKTKTWYYLNIELKSKPLTLINEYSESFTNTFEPREVHKGNAARAIFYFYTMYDIQADKQFFESMLPSLCEWHIQDPVDSMEWVRTNQIASYQENKPNPFVLDCSLPTRTYCANSTQCLLNISALVKASELIISPNPSTGYLRLKLMDSYFAITKLLLVNSLTSSCYEIKSNYNFSDNSYILDLSNLSAGTYFLRVEINNKQYIFRKIIKI